MLFYPIFTPFKLDHVDLQKTDRHMNFKQQQQQETEKYFL